MDYFSREVIGVVPADSCKPTIAEVHNGTRWLFALVADANKRSVIQARSCRARMPKMKQNQNATADLGARRLPFRPESQIGTNN
jgi:hypothetical protein